MDEQYGDSYKIKRSRAGRYSGATSTNYKRTHRFRRAEARSKINLDETEQRLSGLGFYMILSLAALKDVADFGGGYFFLLTFITSSISVVVYLIILVYLFLNNVTLSARKLVPLTASFLIETIPGLSILPATVFNLLIIKKLENSRLSKKSTTHIT